MSLNVRVSVSQGLDGKDGQGPPGPKGAKVDLNQQLEHETMGTQVYVLFCCVNMSV